MIFQKNDRNLQIHQAIIQAAKAGRADLMREFIKLGANPFLQDEAGHNAISYLIATDPAEASSLIAQLDSNFEQEAEDKDELSEENI
jgi:ankyrin repeat protein